MPQQFNDRLTAMMKQVAALFAPEVVTFIQSDNGGPMQTPIIDAGVAAINVSEGVQIPEVDPGISQQLLPMAPLRQSRMIKAPIELIQDSGYPLDEVLADRFGIRLARGIGASNVTQLLLQAPVGRTATGSSSNTGGSETGGTSIGSDDLEALVESVDEAYRASPKCCWLMRQASRQAIFSVQISREDRSISFTKTALTNDADNGVCGIDRGADAGFGRNQQTRRSTAGGRRSGGFVPQ